MEDKWLYRALLISGLFGIFLLVAFLKLVAGPVWGFAKKEWIFRVPPERGEIRDSDGRTLAFDRLTYEAYLDLSFLRKVYGRSSAYRKSEIERALEILTASSPSILLSSTRMFLKIGESDSKEEILSKVPPPLVDFVNISMVTERERVKGASIPAILGKVIDGRGIGGVEEYLDSFLRGRVPGKIVLEYTGFVNLQPKVVDFVPPIDGSDVTLSIDLDVQRIVYSELLRAVRESSAMAANAILMEVKTGKILAMVTTRSWNDNVLGYIEPGSTIKPIVYSIALQTKAASPSFHHHCTGRIKPVEWLDITIGDIKAHGDVDMEEALVKSCNTATVKIAGLIKEKIGEKGFYEWLRRFGFGERTGIEIAGESRGALRKPEEWSAIDYAEFAIGQGIGVTPLQLIAAINAVVNGGVYVKPSLLKDSPVIGRRVIDEDVANTIRRYMVGVVEKGTGVKAKVPGLKIAGKTGTAQKAVGGKYVKRYHSLFVGAFPADDPQYILLVHIDDPKGEYLGGDVAAPVFARIVEDIIGMGEEKDIIVYPGVMPDLRGLSLKDVLAVSDVLGLKPAVHGFGVVKRQDPPPGTINPKHLEVWLGF